MVFAAVGVCLCESTEGIHHNCGLRHHRQRLSVLDRSCPLTEKVEMTNYPLPYADSSSTNIGQRGPYIHLNRHTHESRKNY